jgi:AcrR family transcriptional regulator
MSEPRKPASGARAQPAPTTPRKLPKQERARATVGAILDAAGALLVKNGLARATTNHIAETAGVNIGSLYQYFPSKEAIVGAVVDRALEAYEVAMDGAFDEADGLTLENGLRALTEAHVRVLSADAAIHRAVLSHLPEVDRVARYRAAKAHMTARFASYLEEHASEADVEDIPSAAGTMVDCVEAVTLGALIEGGGDLVDHPRVRELLRVAQRYLVRRA